MCSSKVARYVPLVVWVIVILTVLLIPGKIMSYGYLPPDDALRHAAKVVSGKPWSEILVLRSDFTMDPHAGWHAVLGWIYHLQNCSSESLVVMAMFGLMVLVSAAVLPWLRRPEAWLAALLVAAIAAPVFIQRLTFGRPYLFTMAVSFTLLLVWSRLRTRGPGPGEVVVTIGLIAAAAWIHGSFYQLVLPVAGLLLAGRWRPALWFGGCWALGSVMGASLTGHPWQFLGQSVRILFSAFGTHSLARQLVTEFQPTDAACPFVLAVCGMVLWRARTPGWRAGELAHPIFLLAVVGWMLGLANGRFWWDWGLPAAVLWLALEFQAQFETFVAPDSGHRLMLACGLGLGLYLGMTGDRDSRWTRNLTKEYLEAGNPQQEVCLPEPNGIVYSADMYVFYDTFFKNPKAPWRYMLGFEAGMMPPEDLQVMRNVLWNHGDARAYEPWVKKMRPADRLIIPSYLVRTVGAPGIPQLEWSFAANRLWVGRLPRPANKSEAAPRDNGGPAEGHRPEQNKGTGS